MLPLHVSLLHYSPFVSVAEAIHYIDWYIESLERGIPMTDWDTERVQMANRIVAAHRDWVIKSKKSALDTGEGPR